MDSTRAAVDKFLRAFRREVAAVAREGFAEEGRGVVRVDLSLPEGDGPATAAETMYHPLDEIREIAEELDGEARATTEALVRLIEPYDPSRQLVLTAALPGHPPVSLKIQLDRPGDVVAAKGVH